MTATTLTGGHKYEMFSARAWRLQERWYWWCVMVAIDYWFVMVFKEQNHCQNCAKEWNQFWRKTL